MRIKEKITRKRITRFDENLREREIDLAVAAAREKDALHQQQAQHLPYSFQVKNNCVAQIWSGSEEGSYLRLIDCCITQLLARE